MVKYISNFSFFILCKIFCYSTVITLVNRVSILQFYICSYFLIYLSFSILGWAHQDQLGNPWTLQSPHRVLFMRKGKLHPVRPHKFLVVATLDDWCRDWKLLIPHLYIATQVQQPEPMKCKTYHLLCQTFVAKFYEQIWRL